MVAAQGGDAEAYRALLRACVPRIAGVARRVGVRDEAVDDVIQEVLVAIDRARASYDPSRRFLPWLHAIAQRRSIDNLRQTGRRVSREVHDDDAFLGFPDGARGPGDEVERRQDREGLLAAVATLPPRQREAVERLALAEESLDEASRATGRSKVALKVNLHRGIHALRARLAAGTSRDG